jgi:chorismate synthase
VTFLSGLESGITLGTPIALFVANEDQRPSDYRSMETCPRPSHADYTYICKYGIKASSGGGRASARETIGRYTSSRVEL